MERTLDMEIHPKKLAPTNGNSPAPFFDNLRREMDEIWDRFRGYPMVSNMGQHLGASGQIIPAIDVQDSDDAVEITAEVPGVEEADLDVTLNGDVLVLSGEKKSKREEKDTDYLMVERRYGNFRRHIPLGFTPEPDAISAEYEGGLLRLRVTKPAEIKQSVRKIKIGSK